MVFVGWVKSRDNSRSSREPQVISSRKTAWMSVKHLRVFGIFLFSGFFSLYSRWGRVRVYGVCMMRMYGVFLDKASSICSE